jgi:signal transduction histidine kinase
MDRLSAKQRSSVSGRIVMLMNHGRDVAVQSEVKAELHQEPRIETIRLLAAGMAHDFNNILQAICSGLELILDETLSASAREYAVTALIAAQRGAQLTRNLLTYATHQVLRPSPIDLRQFLPQISPALKAAIGANNRLGLGFAGGPAIAFADETSLHTAMVNLAVNAGRAMTDGGLLRIQTETGYEPGDCRPWVKIKLWDSGTGTHDANWDGCPEPFFTTSGFSGPGLALSMVQSFATQSGGKLRLASRLGEGNLAILTLPAYTPDQARDPVQEWRLATENRESERKMLATSGVDA